MIKNVTEDTKVKKTYFLHVDKSFLMRYHYVFDMYIFL